MREEWPCRQILKMVGGGRRTIKHTIKNKMKSNAAKKKMMMLDWLTVLKKITKEEGDGNNSNDELMDRFYRTSCGVRESREKEKQVP